MTHQELAAKVYEVAHLKGQFLLRSGQTSHQYFDKYQFEARPQILKAIAEQLQPLLPQGFDLLGAMEMGGIPVATALSMNINRPMVLLRKEAKKYGTCKFAEGPDIQGKKICIVEDVITTGGAVVQSVNMLREQGAKVEDVVCVINRSTDGAPRLKALDLKVHSLFTLKDFPES